MESPLKSELLLVIHTLRTCASLSQSLVSASASEKLTLEKDDLSPVTVADFAIQALLVCTLQAKYPHDTFVGEEDAQELRSNPILLERVWELVTTYGTVQDGDDKGPEVKVPSSKGHLCDLVDQCGSSSPRQGRTWVFDPIDGTKTFVRGELYAINVGLLVDGEQAMGVVGCPNFPMERSSAPLTNQDVDSEGKGCIVFAVKGYGTWIQPLADRGTYPKKVERRFQGAQLSNSDIRFVSCTTMADSALMGVHPVIASRLNAAPFPAVDLVAWVLRWVSLALGFANTTVWVYKSTQRHAKIWDHAGAMLLFEETGGVITDCRGRQIDWMAGRKMTNNFGFVASFPGARERVADAVGSVLIEQGHQDMMS